MSYLDDRTILSDLKRSSCSGSTDVVYIETPNPGGNPDALGYAPCAVWVNAYVCNQSWTIVSPQHVAQYAPFPQDPSNVEINYIKTIRHETGHTVGLDHPGNFDSADCMVQGPIVNDLNQTAYNDHNKGDINDTY